MIRWRVTVSAFVDDPSGHRGTREHARYILADDSELLGSGSEKIEAMAKRAYLEVRKNLP